LNKKLYVGNLSWGVIADDLAHHFKQAGTVVSSIIIMDRDTGRSRGFGFVEMLTEDEARHAIETFDKTDLSGRPLAVREAKPPNSAVAPPPISSGSVSGDPSGGTVPFSTVEDTPVFVQNIKDFAETAIAGEEFSFDFAGKRFTLTAEDIVVSPDSA